MIFVMAVLLILNTCFMVMHLKTGKAGSACFSAFAAGFSAFGLMTAIVQIVH
jgi:hypothetical protein